MFWRTLPERDGPRFYTGRVLLTRTEEKRHGHRSSVLFSTGMD